jgi:hypothetical protein
MDGERMNMFLFEGLSALPEELFLAAHLVIGALLGILYFQSIWWSASHFVGRGRMATTIGLMLSRFVILAGLMTLAALEGALPLLFMSLGLFAARFFVMRKLRGLAS